MRASFRSRVVSVGARSIVRSVKARIYLFDGLVDKLQSLFNFQEARFHENVNLFDPGVDDLQLSVISVLHRQRECLLFWHPRRASLFVLLGPYHVVDIALLFTEVQIRDSSKVNEVREVPARIVFKPDMLVKSYSVLIHFETPDVTNVAHCVEVILHHLPLFFERAERIDDDTSNDCHQNVGEENLE